MIAPTPFDRVQYTLSYQGTESVTIQEIRNWGEDEKEYSRNNDYDGIFAKFSNALEFVGDGKDFIMFVYDTYGINAEVYIKKEERHPTTDVWTEVFFGFIDLSTIEVTDTVLKAKVNSGGLEQILKTREGERVELDRETTLDGSALIPLETIDIEMSGRDIFLASKLVNSVEEVIYNNSAYISPTLKVEYSSDERVITTYKNFLDDTYFVGYNTSPDLPLFPQAQQFFYFDNDRPKNLTLHFDLDIDVMFNHDWPERQDIMLIIQKSKIGEDPAYPYPVEKIQIITLRGQGGLGEQNITYKNFDPVTIHLEKGECLALVWTMRISLNNFEHRIWINKNDITITEDSTFDPTRCKMVLAHEMGDRLIEIITGKKAFYSQALGRMGVNDYTEDGDSEGTGLAHGFWIRGFEKDPENDQDRFKPITTSWRDFMEAMRVTHNLGVGIDLKGRRERIRMEKRDFFFQENTTIRLPNVVQNITRSVAAEFFYSAIEVGYEKGGEYEEAMGLDEYNAKSNFTTVITRIKNIFTAISPYRTDSYGAEFARRKPKRSFPTEDSRYDQDIFQFDLQKYLLQDNYFIRKGANALEGLAQNVYSPETAYNLRYSPANILLKHRKRIAMGLIKYPFDFIRYGSSTANSKLITQLQGDEPLREDADIPNSRLGRPLAKPEWVTFDHECNFFVMKQVEGFSTINGKEVPNFYGLVEYKINDEGDVERGFLFNLQPNGVGNWKVLRR